MEECIAAVSTPFFTGAMATIKLSGEGCFKIAEEVFVAAKGKSFSKLKGYEAAYGKFVENGEAFDDGVALVFRAPNSYTGEDVVELSCHGGLFIVEKILNLCFKAGAKPAKNGEFTKRAFLNGKLSLTQAEAVKEIIEANSSVSFKAAKNLKNGLLFKKSKQICGELTKICGHLQAVLDYPEEGVEDVNFENLKTDLDRIRLKLKDMVDSAKFTETIKTGVKTAIVGLPNVGKSTLMNLLCGFDKSIVTNICGTTRDVVEFDVEIGGVLFKLQDTAGIRETENEIEKIGIEKAKQVLNQADLILFVVDCFSGVDYSLLKVLKDLKNVSKIYVHNKIDLGFSGFFRCDVEFFKLLKTSKEDLKSIENLKKEMLAAVNLNHFFSDEIIMVNSRQKSAFCSALFEVCEAIKAAENRQYIDIIENFLENAIDWLLQLSGEKASDRVIEEIFSKFCVGK